MRSHIGMMALLVVPAAMAALARPAASAGGLLVLGWGVGAGIAAVGATLSYLLDLPTGATIVCAFGICLVLQMGLFNRRVAAPSERRGQTSPG